MPSSGPLRTILMSLVAAVTAMAGCGSADETGPTDDPGPTAQTGITDDTGETGSTDQTAGTSQSERYPDVVAASASLDLDGTWTVSATLSSPYDSPDRYADAWRVVGPDGTVYGTRELTHDHAGEQPFTRTLSGVAIPDDVATVTVEGRDQVSGWGGATIEVTLDRS